MPLAVSPTQSEVQTVLRAFLLGVLPFGVDIVEGRDNLVPEPAATSFVVMTALRRARIETNTDAYLDTAFTAAIIGTTMAVSSVELGAVLAGATVFGAGVIPGTTVARQLNGPVGGPGNYVVAPAQTGVGSESMAAGTSAATGPTEVVYQLDVHAATPGASADLAQTITTMFRDPFAYDLMQALNPAVAPLHADDPVQVPFENAENQYETRWVVEAHMQVNQVVSGMSQQFAAALAVDLVDVDGAFPP